MITRALKRAVGGWEFLSNRSLQAGWSGPFNGQRFRLRIFADLLHSLPLTAVVETGTFRGTTTALFASLSIPVYSVEASPRNFGYSQARFFFSRHNVHLHSGDSRSFLRRLSKDPSVPKGDVFFYLDAHWNKDLPLREELQIVFGEWQRPVVMVDDFCVPGSTYAFDSYGPESTLDLAYVAPVASQFDLAAFLPAAGAERETGHKRGCVVLSDQATARTIEDQVLTLRRAPSIG